MSIADLARRLAETLKPDSNHIMQSVKWYAVAAGDTWFTCWPRALGEALQLFADPLSAVSSLLIRIESQDYDMPRRFRDLPFERLSVDRAHCFPFKSNERIWLQRQLIHLRIDGVHPNGWSYGSFAHVRKDIETWSGHVGAVMRAMVRDRYWCSNDLGCTTKLTVGLAYVPADYQEMLTSVELALDSEDVCFSLGSITSGALPTGYWFV